MYARNGLPRKDTWKRTKLYILMNDLFNATYVTKTFVLNHLLQTQVSHWNFISPVCILIWTCKSLSVANAFVHSMHLNGFSLWCTAICLANVFFTLYDFSQKSHLKLLFIWTKASCCMWDNVLNRLLQISQTHGNAQSYTYWWTTFSMRHMWPKLSFWIISYKSYEKAHRRKAI
jgi:hypothetical protein